MTASVQKFILYLVIIFAFTGPLFFSIEVGSIHLFPYRFLLLFAWMFFLSYIFMNKGKLIISNIKVREYLQFLAFWCIYAFFSLIWALSKPFAVRQIMFLLMGFSVIFFIVYYFSNIKDLKRSYYLWVLILVALIPIGMWENLTGNHLSVSGLIGAPLVNKYMPSTVFGNPNDFATYIALSIPFIVSLIHYTKRIFVRLFGILVFSISFYLLIKTLSRANYIVIILEFIFFLVFLLSTRVRFKVILTICLVLLVLFIVNLNTILVQNLLRNNIIFQQIQSILSLWSLEYDSTRIRINLIKNSLVFLQNSLGFGVGAGNAEYYMANYAIYNTWGLTNPHNWWVEILVNYGVVVFIGYILYYFSLFRNLYKIYFRLKDRLEKMICEALILGLFGFLFASISSSSIFALGFNWLFFAFALAFLNYYRNKPKEVNL